MVTPGLDEDAAIVGFMERAIAESAQDRQCLILTACHQSGNGIAQFAKTGIVKSWNDFGDGLRLGASSRQRSEHGKEQDRNKSGEPIETAHAASPFTIELKTNGASRARNVRGRCRPRRDLKRGAYSVEPPQVSVSVL